MSAPMAHRMRRRRRPGRFGFRLVALEPMTWPTAVGRSLLAALRSANEVAMDEALMGLQRVKLRAARLASQFCNGGQRKSGDVLGNFGDLGLADFEVGI